MRPRPPKLAALAVLIALAAAATAWLAVSIDVAASLRRQATDSLLPRGHASQQVVVVAFDRPFIALGRAQPTRAYGGITGVMTDSKARTTVIEPDAIAASATGFSQEFLDQYLGEAFRAAGNVVMALPGLRLVEPRDSSSLPVLDPVPNVALADAAAATGFAADAGSTIADAHSLQLAAQIRVGRSHNGDARAFVPSVALVAWLRATGRDPTTRVSDRTADIGGVHVPTEGAGRLRIRYVRSLLPGGSQVISAFDLIDGQVPIARLRGKTVFVGVKDPELAQVPGPVGANGRLAPVFVEANAFNTLLTRSFLRPASPFDTVLTAGALAFVTALAVLFLPFWIGWAPSLFIAGVYRWYVDQRFTSGVVSDFAVPFAAIVFAFLGGALTKAIFEIRRRRRVSRLFSRYVPDSVAKELLDSDAAEAAASGQRLDVAVLFADIRGFTPIAATLEPAQVRELLDAYYEVMTNAIRHHEGTVMQFVGDEVFAVFGAPVPRTDAASAALDCAREMLMSEPDLTRALATNGLPPVEFGIGLHLGPVIAAHVGTTFRRQYTVVGDTVNIASRLCGAARAGELVCSDAVVDAVGNIPDAEELGTLELKGVSRRILGYRICASPRPGEPATARFAS